MSKQQVFLLVFITSLAFAALPGIMIGTPEQPGEGEEGTSQVYELSTDIRDRLPNTELDLQPTTEDERAEIRYSRKININEADIDELQEIPRVGVNTAERIVQFREEGGVFYSLNDLTQIERIGERTVENMSPYITVGREYEEKAPAAEEAGAKIDINTAEASRLEELPGIGATYARNIVEYREKTGGFARAEDLKNVTGIGPSIYEDLRDRIEVSEVSGISRPAAEPDRTGRININQATAEELEELPGVGPTTAERIVEYRNQHGSFSSFDELTNVQRIGPATVSRLREEADI